MMAKYNGGNEVNFDFEMKIKSDLLNSFCNDNGKECSICAGKIPETYKDRYRIILNKKSQVWRVP